MRTDEPEIANAKTNAKTTPELFLNSSLDVARLESELSVPSVGPIKVGCPHCASAKPVDQPYGVQDWSKSLGRRRRPAAWGGVMPVALHMVFGNPSAQPLAVVSISLPSSQPLRRHEVDLVGAPPVLQVFWVQLAKTPSALLREMTIPTSSPMDRGATCENALSSSDGNESPPSSPRIRGAACENALSTVHRVKAVLLA